jgi:large subunit ribosomal protein L15
MPMHRRLPKKGFNNTMFRDKIETVCIGDLESFEDGTVITEALIIEAGLVTRVCDSIKILGDGELTKKLTIQALACSASAKEKIEKAGGTITSAS